MERRGNILNKTNSQSTLDLVCADNFSIFCVLRSHLIRPLIAGGFQEAEKFCQTTTWTHTISLLWTPYYALRKGQEHSLATSSVRQSRETFTVKERKNGNYSWPNNLLRLFIFLINPKNSIKASSFTVGRHWIPLENFNTFYHQYASMKNGLNKSRNVASVFHSLQLSLWHR